VCVCVCVCVAVFMIFLTSSPYCIHTAVVFKCSRSDVRAIIVPYDF